MHPLPPKWFGPDSGLPCLFTADDTSGETSVGYLVKQLGLYRYIVSNGTLTRVVNLAQSLADVANTSKFAPATFTMFLTLDDDETIEHIRHITASRCSTIEGSDIGWVTGETVAGRGCIGLPSMTLTYYRLLEDGSQWLLETGDNWLTQQAPPYMLLENGGFWLLESGGYVELEGITADG